MAMGPFHNAGGVLLSREISSSTSTYPNHHLQLRWTSGFSACDTQRRSGKVVQALLRGFNPGRERTCTKFNVFVSYAHDPASALFARQLTEDLKSAGFTVWL